MKTYTFLAGGKTYDIKAKTEKLAIKKLIDFFWSDLENTHSILFLGENYWEAAELYNIKL
jgi:hypothetical protein